MTAKKPFKLIRSRKNATGFRNVVRVRTLANFADRLTEKNFYKIGSGCFGSAYVKGKICWKVGLRANGRDCSATDGYIAYAQSIAMRILRSEHAPKIKLILIDQMGRFAVLMERLQDFSSALLDSQVAYAVTRDKIAYGDNDVDGNSIYSLEIFMKKIMDSFSHSWNIDMHSGNVMVRRDGQFVITNPISFLRDRSPVKDLLNKFEDIQAIRVIPV